jgi:hypothetical protein
MALLAAPAAAPPPPKPPRKPLAELSNQHRQALCAFKRAVPTVASPQKCLDFLSHLGVKQLPSPRSINRILQHDRVMGSPEKSLQRGGNKQKRIAPEERKIVVDSQDEDNTLTYAELKQRLVGAGRRSLSDGSIRNILVEADFTTKVLTVETESKNNEETKNLRIEYVKWAIESITRLGKS